MENQWLTPVLKTMEPMKLENMVFAKPHYTPKRRDVKQGYGVRKLFSVNRSRCQEPAISLDQFSAVLMSECPSPVAFQYALPDAQPTYDVYDDINVCFNEICVTSVNPPPTLTKVAEAYTTAEELWIAYHIIPQRRHQALRKQQGNRLYQNCGNSTEMAE
ncbi:hypothetical protein WMY93_023586 [Mugilogobius chulae]|uniref:Uncharacterized protein n=1 Tax=Mugilogobius chulae TaxID=88201 RepID=A0AAW0NF73_9GOBI